MSVRMLIMCCAVFFAGNSSGRVLKGAPIRYGEKPNVVMICIDDLNDWVGCLGGHPDVQTPHIDSLAKRGRNFVNAHCSVTVCSPSRISIMSGLPATTHGSYELGPGYSELPQLQNVPCLQEYFHDAGYRTLAGGKVLHKGFRGRLSKVIDVQLSGRKGGPRPRQTLNWPGKAWDWGAFPPTNEQMFDYQLAMETAQKLQKSYDQPFFLSVGFFRPHVPMYVPPEWLSMYDEQELTLPLVAADDMHDIPLNFQNLKMIAPTFAEIKAAGKWRSLVQAYLASTSFVDHCVGQVLAAIDRSPHADNTIIVLWSDHGFHLGEKQAIAKRTLWEESTRVPLIIAGPGIEPGKDCVEPASLLDVYPTLVELCDLPENTHLEGISLVPQLRNPEKERKEPALTSSYYGNHAVRDRDWRYIRYADGAEELYDHRVDPQEWTNLAEDPRFKEIKNHLVQFIPAQATPEVKPPAQREQRRN